METCHFCMCWRYRIKSWTKITVLKACVAWEIQNPRNHILFRVEAIAEWFHLPCQSKIKNLVRWCFLARRMGCVSSWSNILHLFIFPFEWKIPCSSQNKFIFFTNSGILFFTGFERYSLSSTKRLADVLFLSDNPGTDCSQEQNVSIH